MKRLRTKEPKSFDGFKYKITKSYIKNNNTIDDLKGLCDFYDIEYDRDQVKDKFVKALHDKGRENKLRKPDLVRNYKDRDIKLTREWVDIAKDVVSSGVNAYTMSKQEIYRLVVDEIERRYEKGDLSKYLYEKCQISYRTFMRYVNAENSYKGLNEKSAELLDELQKWMEIKETRQKADLFDKMVASDTKGRQRYWELISTKYDDWNKTKKVDQKLDWQIAMEEMMSEIGSQNDDLTSNDDDGQTEAWDNKEQAGE